MFCFANAKLIEKYEEREKSWKKVVYNVRKLWHVINRKLKNFRIEMIHSWIDRVAFYVSNRQENESFLHFGKYVK